MADPLSPHMTGGLELSTLLATSLVQNLGFAKWQSEEWFLYQRQQVTVTRKPSSRVFPDLTLSHRRPAASNPSQGKTKPLSIFSGILKKNR